MRAQVLHEGQRGTSPIRGPPDAEAETSASAPKAEEPAQEAERGTAELRGGDGTRSTWPGRGSPAPEGAQRRRMGMVGRLRDGWQQPGTESAAGRSGKNGVVDKEEGWAGGRARGAAKPPPSGAGTDAPARRFSWLKRRGGERTEAQGSKGGGLTSRIAREERFKRAFGGQSGMRDEELQRYTHPVLSVIRQRAREASRPGARRDGFKVGLCVEGGGMRGTVSGAMLKVIGEHGLTECFDVVYGSSAGAFNSAYFLAGQYDALDTYTRLAANGPDFIDLRRLKQRDPVAAPVLRLGMLVDQTRARLDFERLQASPVPLKVVASSITENKTVALTDFESKADLLKCLEASATIPMISGHPVEHRGDRFVDAAVFQPVPYHSGVADGCTHLLILCSRPHMDSDMFTFTGLHVRKRVKGLLDRAVKRMFMSPNYMRAAWKEAFRAARRERDLIAMAVGAEGERLPRDLVIDSVADSLPEDHVMPYILPVVPELVGLHPGKLSVCTDIEKLDIATRQGAEAAFDGLFTFGFADYMPRDGF